MGNRSLALGEQELRRHAFYYKHEFLELLQLVF